MNNKPTEQKNKEDKLRPLVIVATVCLCTIILINSFTNLVNSLVEQKTDEIINNHMANSENIETLTSQKETLKGTTVKDVVIDESKVTELDVSEIAEKNKKAMVSIRNIVNVADFSADENTKDELKVSGTGSGVIIGDNKEELWILTNRHVIASARKIEIEFNGGQTLQAYVKGYNSNKDFAVLSIKLKDLKDSTKKNIAVAKIGDSTKIKAGQTIIVLGDALNQGQAVTKGVISLTSTPIPLNGNVENQVIQIDAAINKGNSGGALLNIKGELIGIPTAKNTGDTVENIGYAIPISDIKEEIEILCAKEDRIQTSLEEEVYLGVTVLETPMGLLVQTIENHSPAYRSQLCVGDYITMINKQPVASIIDLQSELWFYKQGQIVELRISRPDGKDYTTYNVNITLQRKN
jgi:serine protease Do